MDVKQAASRFRHLRLASGLAVLTVWHWSHIVFLLPRGKNICNYKSRASLVSRQAGGIDPERLKQEAAATEGFLKAVTDFFRPQAPEPSQEEINAVERREKASIQAEKVLRELRLSVLVNGEDGEPLRRSAPIGILQSLGQQHLALFAGVQEQALRDVLLSMRLSAKDFAERNILVAPVLISMEEGSLVDLSPQLMKSKLLSQVGLALPSPDDDEDRSSWGQLFVEEFVEAQEQGVWEQAQDQGLAVLVNKNGKIVRRGVGRPDWQIIFNELGI